MSVRTFELFNPRKKKFGNVEVSKGDYYGADYDLPSHTTVWNVYLHKNRVAEVIMNSPDSIFVHHVNLYDRGWQTVTTKECISNVLSKCKIPARPWQKNYQWYLSIHGDGWYDVKKAIPFFEGISISPSGEILNPEKAPVILKEPTERMRLDGEDLRLLRQISEHKNAFTFDNLADGLQEKLVKKHFINLTNRQMSISIEGRFEIKRLEKRMEELKEKGYRIYW